MKKNNLIIEFFEGNLEDSEKEKLLLEISINADLSDEFEKYKKLYTIIQKSNEVRVSENYLESLLPKFRSSKNKSSFILKPVFASAFLIFFALIGILIYNVLFQNKNNHLDDVSSLYEISLIDDENLEYFSSIFNKEELDELLYEKLTYNNNKLSLLEYYFHLDNNYSIISETDAEEIYNELISKKIL